MNKNCHLYKLYILLIFSVLAACKAPVQEETEDNTIRFDKPLLETNQYMTERHRDLIEAFISRVGWDMSETSSGLWIQIIDHGNQNASTIQEGDFVSYSYETKLMNGTLCYASNSNEPKEIVVGKGNVEAGIEEGIRHLRIGSRARLVLPPYLAHGNFGDLKKIPGSAILIVDIEVLDVKR